MAGRRTLAEPTPKDGGTRLLGDVLVDSGIVTADDLKAVLNRQQDSGKRIGELLVEIGLVKERDLARGIATQRDCEFIDLRQKSPEQNAIEKVPETLARKYNALALELNDDSINIALSDPSAEALEALAKAAGIRVVPAVAPASEIKRSINNSYRATNSLTQHIEVFEEATKLYNSYSQTASADFGTTDDAPVVQVVNLIVTQARRDRASDIHIEPQDDQVRVRFRVDGALHDVTDLPGNMGPALISRLKVLAGMNIVERRRPQDGQIAIEVEGQALDIRVSTTPTIWGEKAVLRILDKSRSLYSLDSLGMSDESHKLVTKLVHQPFGMVICAGPTGSGKTTTLYAALNEINSTDRNIMTIEDPVEYIVPSINQIQINEQAGVTFANGLKSILRQDPDVILVGEVRDVETARIAVQSALTGHFVLSSLHATDSVSALQRFLDMGLEAFLIASSVNAVIGQRLLRRICNSCRTEYEPTPEELSFYKESGAPNKAVFYKGVGCNFCSHTGYQDRIGVYEVMWMTDEIRHAVVEQRSANEIKEIALSQGMKTLRDQAIALVAEDVTTVAEVLRTVYAA